MLGIALVVDDVAKGPKLAFSIPLRRSFTPLQVESPFAPSPSADYFARLLRPKPPLCNRPFVLSIDRTTFLGFPVLLPAEKRDSAATLQISAFNAVFVTASDSPLQAHLAKAVQRLAAALLYEEGRCKYVSQQAELMLAGGARAAALPPEPPQATPVCGLFPELRVSSLARELAFIFHSFRGPGSACSLRLNGWLSLELNLVAPASVDEKHVHTYGGARVVPPLTTREAAAGAVLPGGGGGADASEGGWGGRGYTSSTALTPIRPYHALLLLQDSAEDVCRLLPEDASPQLLQLIACASPVRSLRELQGESGIPSSQLLRLAAHLVHWGLAIILTTVTSNAMYSVGVRPAFSSTTSPLSLSPFTSSSLLPQVHPDADASPTLAAEFKTLFSCAGRASEIAEPALQAHPSGGDDSPLPRSLPEALALFSPSSSGPRHAPLLGGSGDARDDAGAVDDIFSLSTGAGRPWRDLVGGLSPAAVATFTRMLAWLLKHGLIRELHTYVYMMWPWQSALSPPVAGAAETPSGGTPAAATAGDSPPWSTEELDYLHVLTEGLPAHAAVLLRRLVSYLRDVAAVGRATSDSAPAAPTGDTALPAGVPAKTGGKAAIGSGIGLGPRGFRLGGVTVMPPVLQLNLRLEDILWRLHTTRQEVLAVLALFPDLFVLSIHE